MRIAEGAKLAWIVAVAVAAPAWGQPFCPVYGESGGWNGDEPEDFTHYVDLDPADGVCDRDGSGALIVGDGNGGIPNGPYPDCDVDEDGYVTSGSDQLAHGHWEYTHLHSQTAENGASESEEKDYLTTTQGLQKDFDPRFPATNNSEGTHTRESVDQTMRFTMEEPGRFERFLRPGLNPRGRYWQVDEWIGPGGTPNFFGFDSEQHLPFLTWSERFFACGNERGTGPCACARNADGALLGAFGGYFYGRGLQAEPAHAFFDCGDAVSQDPTGANARNPQCGMMFAECPGLETRICE